MKTTEDTKSSKIMKQVALHKIHDAFCIMNVIAIILVALIVLGCKHQNYVIYAVQFGCILAINKLCQKIFQAAEDFDRVRFYQRSINETMFKGTTQRVCKPLSKYDRRLPSSIIICWGAEIIYGVYMYGMLYTWTLNWFVAIWLLAINAISLSNTMIEIKYYTNQYNTIIDQTKKARAYKARVEQEN